MSEAADEFAAEAAHELPEGGEPAEQQPHEGGPHGSEPRRDGGRRRRGRRGGRRNRHRNGDGVHGGNDRGPEQPQHEFSSAEELTAPPSPEPNLKEAAADLDAAPRANPRPTPQARVAEQAPQPVAPEEPARRRSTVRERAPVSGGGVPSAPAPAVSAPPASEPVVTDSGDGAESNKPRRSGWWSRRSAGG
jgi:ribonuclease E